MPADSPFGSAAGPARRPAPGRRRRRHEGGEEADGRERWLVSYADFITLLFAFFVVMYGISTVNEGKYRVMSDALVQAFRHERIVMPPASALQPVPRASPAPLPLRVPARNVDAGRRDQERKLLELAGRIKDALEPLVRTGQVRLVQLPRGLAVEISASVLFSPGQAALEPASASALAAVVPVLQSVAEPIQVEGHTDNVPIASTVFPSNWELSSARASAVVRLFVAKGMDPARLSASGFADNRAVESNDSADGRARNRRVTLLILAATPVPQASPVPGY